MSVVRGPVVSEVRHVIAAGTIEQVFRVYAGSVDTLEVAYRVGPIDRGAVPIGHEVISRFDTDLKSGDTWASDSNGLELQYRRRNFRHPLGPNQTNYATCSDPVSCNYFSVNTIASIQDQRSATASPRRRLTVLTDRSEGGSSMATGSLELMLHRRLAHGCRWGMCEPNADAGGKMEAAGINDVLGAEVIIRHWLSVDAVALDGSSPSLARLRARQLNYPPSALFSAAAVAAPAGLAALPSAGALPQNVELTTFQSLPSGDVVLRLTNMYGAGEHAQLSMPTVVDLCALLGKTFCARISHISEMNLAASVLLQDLQRLRWKVAGEAEAPPAPLPAPLTPASMLVTVKPADTRTYKISFKAV